MAGCSGAAAAAPSCKRLPRCRLRRRPRSSLLHRLRMGKLTNLDKPRKRSCRSSATSPAADVAEDLSSEDPIPSSTTLELVEASWVGSSWDLLTGLDVVETGPGELFDEF